jgi:signal transduction histidine kinase
VLQLLFDENIFPDHDPEVAPVEFSLQGVREQAPYEDKLKHVFWILPNISFGMEVMRLRQTSYQVIHELKNKLIAAQSWLNCLREDLSDLQPDLFDNEDIREDIDLAEGAAREGSKLAVGYLQLTKIYAPECVDMDINEVLQRTAADVTAFAADHSDLPVEVALNLGDGLPRAHADPEQLRMAFFNLCKNAVEVLAEFRVDNACVSISSACEDSRVCVTVADNGPGMPEEIAANLFKAFKTKKEGGTGLGLTITKKIVDIHGGTIRCETDSGGTRFIIDL